MAIRFRPEVYQQAQTKWLGQVVLVRPISFAYMTTFAATVAALACLYFAWGQYTKTAAISGHLVPDTGVIKIVAPAAGLVLERRVSEGQSVKKGEVLFVLSAEKQSTSDAVAQATVGLQVAARRDSLRDEASKQKGLHSQQQAALTQKLRDLREEASTLAREEETLRRRAALAQGELSRYRDLHAQKFISEGQLQQKEADLLDQQSRQHATRRTRLSTEREIHALQFELASLPDKGHNAVAAVERALASTEQELVENQARRQTVLSAPEDGTVTAIMTERGQVVGASAALASLMPEGAVLQAQLFAPSRSVGFLRVGSSALLRYQAYPYQKFGHYAGRVTQVSRHALGVSELPLANPTQEPMYRVTVELPAQAIVAQGTAHKLQAGMLVDANIALERRRLYEWAFEPLFSLSGRAAQGASVQ